jgi:hypothetical protein
MSHVFESAQDEMLLYRHNSIGKAVGPNNNQSNHQMPRIDLCHRESAPENTESDHRHVLLGNDHLVMGPITQFELHIAQELQRNATWAEHR